MFFWFKKHLNDNSIKSTNFGHVLSFPLHFPKENSSQLYYISYPCLLTITFRHIPFLSIQPYPSGNPFRKPHITIFAPMFSGHFLLNPRRKAQTFLGAACVGYIDFLIFCLTTSNSQTGRLRKAWLSHGGRIHAGCVANVTLFAEYARKSYIRSLKRREKSAPFCDNKRKRPRRIWGAKIHM